MTCLSLIFTYVYMKNILINLFKSINQMPAEDAAGVLERLPHVGIFEYMKPHVHVQPDGILIAHSHCEDQN